MDIIETFKYSSNGIDFSVAVVCYNSFDGFSDQWKMTDTHEGGVTVQNPNHHRNGYKYGVPLQYSLKERIAHLISIGDDNPSANAYKAAQESLGRDISASDYGFQVSATANGIMLLDGETLGCSFDYSYDDNEDLISAAKDVYHENGIDAAKKAGNDLLANVDGLKNILKVA